MSNYKNIRVTLFLVLCFSLIVITCKKETYEEPIISLENYVIENGFELQVATSEPFIEAPVVMDFDNKGRMWVVEMKGYMKNLEGTGDDLPNGTITILEDRDGDGVTDHSKIFLDSLVLPRAVAHVYGGLLYAEPPNLWFVDIKDDKPQNRILVDSLFADGGNVEHQPNGLMMHIDNWIYNAKSNFRYQKKKGEWLKEPTTYRGQWGITKDNFGRLYYNTNSTQLIGDYVLPNTVINNEYYKPKAAVSKKLTPNQRVYPLHATAVNRGYVKGVLDKDTLLVNVTSSCGPLIYRGDKFGDEYLENAFVCVPEANLIKRNILTFKADSLSGKQAISNKEFIASTDEGFRPVNLFNGPDGNMYIVDMHRGIIQDKAFLTPYLHDLLAKRKLDTIIGMGRILRVVNKSNKDSESVTNIENLKTSELVDLLNHSNGWLRDRAQQLLIHKKENNSISLLNSVLENKRNSLAQIHALHTLNGMGALYFDFLEKFIVVNNNSEVLSHAFILLKQFATIDNSEAFVNLTKQLIDKNDAIVDLYVLSVLGDWMIFLKDELFPIAYKLSVKYKERIVYQESLISSLKNIEEDYKLFLKRKTSIEGKTMFSGILAKTIYSKEKNEKNFIYTRKNVGTDSRTAGYRIFRNLCATCHGIDGAGVENLAPPLKNSKYVTESSERLALVILHGLAGPIHVNGEFYKLNTTMPGLANNPEFSDKDIQSIINYLRNAFPGEAEKIELDKIKFLRTQTPKAGGVFSENELLKIKVSK